MSKIKVSSVTKGQPPCPGPAPKPIPMPRPAPTDAPRPFPPPPPFFMPGPCCPSATQVVDNITVQSLDPEKIEVVEGTYLGMKAFGIDAKTFDGIGTTGMVPMPKEGDEGKVLTSTGEWSEFVVELPQSDWNQEDAEQPDYIKNKPNLAKVATTGSYNDLKDKPTVAQSDWAQNDSTKADYIKNRPDIDAMIDSAVSTERDRATEAETTLHTEIVTETERAIAGEAAATTEVQAGENATITEETAEDGHKIYTVNADGKPQVQADWKQDDETMVDYIKNRPGVFTGASVTVNGKTGFVPAPAIEDREKFLCGDGTWQDVTNTRACTAAEMDEWIDEVELNG